MKTSSYVDYAKRSPKEEKNEDGGFRVWDARLPCHNLMCTFYSNTPTLRLSGLEPFSTRTPSC